MPRHWWENLLHNQTALRLKLRLSPGRTRSWPTCRIAAPRRPAEQASNQDPRWLLLSLALYLVGVVLWFDVFFWMALTIGAFSAGLIALLTIVGVAMRLLAPNTWSGGKRTRD